MVDVNQSFPSPSLSPSIYLSVPHTYTHTHIYSWVVIGAGCCVIVCVALIVVIVLRSRDADDDHVLDNASHHEEDFVQSQYFEGENGDAVPEQIYGSSPFANNDGDVTYGTPGLDKSQEQITYASAGFVNQSVDTSVICKLSRIISIYFGGKFFNIYPYTDENTAAFEAAGQPEPIVYSALGNNAVTPDF